MFGKKSVPVAVAISAVMLILSIVAAVLVFGPKTVGPVLEEEKSMVEAWLAWQGLDAYGNRKGTSYPEGYPEDRYDYIRANHRDRPWQAIDLSWLETFAPGERQAFDAWAEKMGLNMYGDPEGTMYTGGTPLFNESTGETIPADLYILMRNPKRPWNHLEAK